MHTNHRAARDNERGIVQLASQDQEGLAVNDELSGSAALTETRERLALRAVGEHHALRRERRGNDERRQAPLEP